MAHIKLRNGQPFKWNIQHLKTTIDNMWAIIGNDFHSTFAVESVSNGGFIMNHCV
jgi:hypothetical protein